MSKIVLLVVVSLISILLISPKQKELAIMIRIACGILIIYFLSTKIIVVMDMVRDILSNVNIDDIYLKTCIKVVLLAYITEFISEICKDTGEGSIASHMMLAGKVLIMYTASPIVLNILKQITNMIN